MTPTDPLLERDFARPDLDDSTWETVTVQGHWRSTPAFGSISGPHTNGLYENPTPARCG